MDFEETKTMRQKMTNHYLEIAINKKDCRHNISVFFSYVCIHSIEDGKWISSRGVRRIIIACGFQTIKYIPALSIIKFLSLFQAWLKSFISQYLQSDKIKNLFSEVQK